MVSAMISLESGISEIHLPKRNKIFQTKGLWYKIGQGTSREGEGSTERYYFFGEQKRGFLAWGGERERYYFFREQREACEWEKRRLFFGRKWGISGFLAERSTRRNIIFLKQRRGFLGLRRRKKIYYFSENKERSEFEEGGAATFSPLIISPHHQ